MQPALLETRHQVLHGQEVEVKVYGPGGAHCCDRKRNVKMRACPICRPWGREYDLDRQGMHLKNIERRWPVALGITGRAPDWIPLDLIPLEPPMLPANAPLSARATANAIFSYANHLAATRNAKARDNRKQVWHSPEEIARRKKNNAASQRSRKRRREKEDAYFKAEIEQRETRARFETAKAPCAANQCEMGDWIQLDWRQFHDLMGRKATTLETRAVRGCSHCPRIESKLAPHFGAL
jgi:hypothetical protein